MLSFCPLGTQQKLSCSLEAVNGYLVSSCWASSLAPLQAILLTVATENIFLLPGVVPSCPQDYIRTQCGQGLSYP